MERNLRLGVSVGHVEGFPTLITSSGHTQLVKCMNTPTLPSFYMSDSFPQYGVYARSTSPSWSIPSTVLASLEKGRG
jgi:hypothetical protein